MYISIIPPPPSVEMNFFPRRISLRKFLDFTIPVFYLILLRFSFLFFIFFPNSSFFMFFPQRPSPPPPTIVFCTICIPEIYIYEIYKWSISLFGLSFLWTFAHKNILSFVFLVIRLICNSYIRSLIC